MFRFGAAYGAVLSVLGALALPFRLITPQSWKKRFCVPSGANKEHSRQLALSMWPAHASAFARKRDHGRSEAAPDLEIRERKAIVAKELSIPINLSLIFVADVLFDDPNPD
jgi:hypothetical protein